MDPDRRGRVVECATDWQSRLLDDGQLRLDEWDQQGRLSVVKKGPQRIVYRADLPGGPVYVKHFLVPSWRETLRQWIRRGKGRNEGRRTQFLEAIGVPTITPIALGEQRKRKFLFENYLITPAIPEFSSARRVRGGTDSATGHGSSNRRSGRA